jgi:biofilm PGA synthesis N-glycosyltransferase PgaC
VAVEIAFQTRGNQTRGNGTLSLGTTGHLQPAHDQLGAPRLDCSVGLMAHNEEGNIANAIEAVLAQQPTFGELVELIVVASGCTDRTTDIVASLALEDPRIRLVVQERRAGKASAINLFIAAARAPILVLVNGDNIVTPGTIDALVEQFQDQAVGMVGGKPIPVNDDDTFLGYAVHLLWRLHDQIARESPKLGEIVAFRNIVPSIPTDTAVDELSLQAVVTELGYRLVYEPRAVVYNCGPTTTADFLRQRRRIFAGHLRIARNQGYAASTMSVTRIGRALLQSESDNIARAPLWAAGTVALETTARVLGYYDFLRRRPHHIWTTVATTKGDIGESAHQKMVESEVVDLGEERLQRRFHATASLLQHMARQVAARGTCTCSPTQERTIILDSQNAVEVEQRRGHRRGKFCSSCAVYGILPVVIVRRSRSRRASAPSRLHRVLPRRRNPDSPTRRFNQPWV